MNKIRYLLSNINVLNVILAGILVLLGVYVASPGKDATSVKPKVKKAVVTEAEEKKEPEEVKSPFPTDYSVIAEQNLFHPDRKIPVEKVAVPPPPKPDFVLYGTLLSDDLKLAYMEDKKSPQSTPGRPNRQTAVKLGDAISGFILKEIQTDRVIMIRGEETMVVNLDEAKGRVTAEVVSTQPGQPGVPTHQPAQPRSGITRQAQQPFVPTSQNTNAGSERSPRSSRESRTTRPSGPGGGFINLFRR